MPRYYFDVYDGQSHLTDEEGLELDGIESVRVEAIRTLPEIAKDLLPNCDERSIVVAARDESGQTVLMAALSLNVRRMA
jgi:hypothetical protein